jgi:hypothetical protein
MSTITYDEFLLLPKGPPTKKLIPGKTYYIKNGVRKNKSQIDVYVGKFDKISPTGSFYFDDVEYLVKVPGEVKTGAYGKSGWIYTEALATSPTQEDRKRKSITIKELKSFINTTTRVRSQSKSHGGKKRKTMKKTT